MKVIFLDMDGVLNNRESMKRVLGRCCPPENNPSLTVWPRCVRRLQRIADATGAVLVVSSVWRKIDGTKSVSRALQWAGWRHPPLIGYTPNLNKCECRGEEIDLWMELNPGVTSYVILDDDSKDIYQKDRLVLTRHEPGLRGRDVDAAIAILGRPLP